MALSADSDREWANGQARNMAESELSFVTWPSAPRYITRGHLIMTIKQCPLRACPSLSSPGLSAQEFDQALSEACHLSKWAQLIFIGNYIYYARI